MTFAAGVSRQCVNVGITDDNIKENLEICALSLSVVAGSSICIDQTQSSSEICITDDDRKSLMSYLPANILKYLSSSYYCMVHQKAMHGKFKHVLISHSCCL